MKIATPKLAPAPQTTKSGNTGIVPPAQTAKSGNTGIVPPSADKPTDSFKPATPTGTGAATGTSSIALPKPTSVTTYALPAHLEAHRATFDKYGEHIAKLPSQAQPVAIDNATDKIFKDLGGIAGWDEINKGLHEAVAYFRRGTTTEDPMSYVMSREPTESPTPGGGLPSQDSGSTPGTKGPATKDVGDFFRNYRQQAQQDTQTEEAGQRFRRMRRFGF
jgi:hypothetical protein